MLNYNVCSFSEILTMGKKITVNIKKIQNTLKITDTFRYTIAI